MAVGIGINNNNSDGPIKIVDASGNRFTFDKPCERVVVYSKYIAEAMILMGASDLVVGTTTTVKKDTNYESYYQNAIDIGTKTTSGTDIILTLNADVIISYGNNDNTQLVNTKIPVVEIGASKITEIKYDLTVLGKLLGMENKSEKIIKWFDKYNDAFNKPRENNTKIALETFSLTKLSYCNPTSTPGVLLKTVGGKNIFTETSTTYTYPSADTLISLNPEILIVVSYNANWNAASLDAYLETIKSRSGWNSIDAVANDKIYMVSNDIIGGIRSVIGAMFMLSLIDDNYKDVDISKIVDEYNAIANTKFNNMMVYK